MLSLLFLFPFFLLFFSKERTEEKNPSHCSTLSTSPPCSLAQPASPPDLIVMSSAMPSPPQPIHPSIHLSIHQSTNPSLVLSVNRRAAEIQRADCLVIVDRA
ncbi:unnamed protein product [Gadus morhua 'NCC']